MTCSLMIYAALKQRIREQLNEDIPVITGLNEQHQIVLQVLGRRYQEIYS